MNAHRYDPGTIVAQANPSEFSHVRLCCLVLEFAIMPESGEAGSLMWRLCR